MDESPRAPEVQTVLDAISQLEAIPDAEDRVRAASQLLKEWPQQHRKVREIRQQAVQLLKDRKMTWQQIGDLMGVQRQRAKDIAEGRTWGKRDAPE